MIKHVQQIPEDFDGKLIDVREQSEWEVGHIPEAMLLPLSVLPLTLTEHVEDKHTPIIFYCRSGGRSMMAAQKAIEMGYTDITNLDGGYLEYQVQVEKKQ